MIIDFEKRNQLTALGVTYEVIIVINDYEEINSCSWKAGTRIWNMENG